MPPRFLQRVALLLCGASLSCVVDADAIDSRIYRCESDAECGDGYVCYHGLEPVLSRERAYCLPDCSSCDGFCDYNGACHPICDPDAPSYPADMSCLRINLSGPGMTSEDVVEGLCVAMTACSNNNDCADPVRSVCINNLASSELAELGFELNQMFCIQQGCRAGGNCDPGWSCLADVLEDTPENDMCLPNCTTGRCPPGLECANVNDELICIPGWYGGGLCHDDTNCLVGECVEIRDGQGYAVCQIPCESDDDCEPYQSAVPLQCTELPNLGKVCAQLSVSHPCTDDGICELFELGLTCETLEVEFLGQSYDVAMCSRHCENDGDCEIFGGFCATGGTYGGNICVQPARDGQVCEDDAQCVSWLDGCLPITVESLSYSICSTRCETDADCDAETSF